MDAVKVFTRKINLLTALLILSNPVKVHAHSATEFLNNHYNYRYFTLGLISTGILIYYISYFCREDIENVDTLLNWKKMCLDQKWSKILIKGSFMGSESIFIILGFYIGL